MLHEENMSVEQFRPRGIKHTKGGRIGHTVYREREEEIGPVRVCSNIILTALMNFKSHVKSEGTLFKLIM